MAQNLPNQYGEINVLVEQSYWDRKLGLLQLKGGKKMLECEPQKIESELLLLEGFRRWIRSGAPFNVEAAMRIVKTMKRLKEGGP